MKDAVNATELHLEAGRIEFENVHFSYIDGYGAAGRDGPGYGARYHDVGQGKWPQTLLRHLHLAP